jgi:16S rRNA C1402 (ribose-2'-O) methylase RsmI
MGRKKLLQKLSEFFDMDVRARDKRKEELNDLLSRLKQKEVALKKELEKETDEDRKAKLEQKIDVVHTQRKKGLVMLKELINPDQSAKEPV